MSDPMTAPITPEYLAGLLKVAAATRQNGRTSQEWSFALAEYGAAALVDIPRLIAEIERLGKERDEANTEVSGHKERAENLWSERNAAIARAEKAEAERYELSEMSCGRYLALIRSRDAALAVQRAPAQWRPDPAELLRFAARKIGGNNHHCHWLNAVGYRSDPLDQTLVDHVLKGAADSLEWLAQNPDKARGMMEYRLERQADHAEEG